MRPILYTLLLLVIANTACADCPWKLKSYGKELTVAVNAIEQLERKALELDSRLVGRRREIVNAEDLISCDARLLGSLQNDAATFQGAAASGAKLVAHNDRFLRCEVHFETKLKKEMQKAVANNDTQRVRQLTGIEKRIRSTVQQRLGFSHKAEFLGLKTASLNEGLSRLISICDAAGDDF